MAGGGGQARFRKVLVTAQTGLSLLLMVGAGLFARSLYNLKNQDLGFRTDHLLAFEINPKLNGYTIRRRSFLCTTDCSARFEQSRAFARWAIRAWD